jgi:hypothetical protein
MTEGEWRKYQSYSVSKNNLEDGVAILVVGVATIVAAGWWLDISLPLMLAVLVAGGIFFYKQIRALIDSISSYRNSSREISSSNARTEERSSFVNNDDYDEYVEGTKGASDEEFGEIPVFDEEMEAVKGNRPYRNNGTLDNTPDDAPLEDIPIEEALPVDLVIDEGIDFDASEVNFGDDADFVPQDPDFD